MVISRAVEQLIFLITLIVRLF